MHRHDRFTEGCYASGKVHTQVLEQHMIGLQLVFKCITVRSTQTVGTTVINNIVLYKESFPSSKVRKTCQGND